MSRLIRFNVTFIDLISLPLSLSPPLLNHTIHTPFCQSLYLSAQSLVAAQSLYFLRFKEIHEFEFVLFGQGDFLLLKVQDKVANKILT